MKKVIFACALIISGSIGTVGWAIACSQTVEIGSRTDVIQSINTPGEIIVFALFISMLFIGGIMGMKNIDVSKSIALRDT